MGRNTRKLFAIDYGNNVKFTLAKPGIEEWAKGGVCYKLGLFAYQDAPKYRDAFNAMSLNEKLAVINKYHFDRMTDPRTIEIVDFDLDGSN